MILTNLLKDNFICYIIIYYEMNENINEYNIDGIISINRIKSLISWKRINNSYRFIKFIKQFSKFLII